MQREEQLAHKAKLKIFFGMCAGVGKTYDMLKAAHDAIANGTDLVVGYAETHKRPETEALLQGLPIVPRKVVDYKGTTLDEMDIDAILARKPKLVLVDELAHTNAPGSRHKKRFMDVEELLDNGIDVWTTLNVQHLESRADTVAQITGSMVRETVPDSILEIADEVELIDIPADELLTRLAEGKVYSPERSKRAVENFFRKGNLTALREMALRITAERVDRQLREYMQRRRIPGPWKSSQRLIVGISSSPYTARLLRWARRLAYSLDATWLAVTVESSKPISEKAKAQLAENIKLARDLGAEVFSTADDDIIEAILRVARQQNATQILVGKTRELSWFRKSILERLIDRSGELDVFVVGEELKDRRERRRFTFPHMSSGWHQYALAAAAVAGVTMLCLPFSDFLGYQTVSLMLLLVVALLPLRLGAGPVLLAAALSALLWDYLFIPPRLTFVVDKPQDILMLVTYFAIATVAGILTVRIRARQRIVLQREERTSALYRLTRDLSVAVSQDGVARTSIENIASTFQADVVMYLSEADGDIFKAAHPASTLKVDEKEFSVAAWVYWNEKKAGRHTDTLPFAQATYFPLSGPRYPLGVLGVSLRRPEWMPLEQEVLLENFARQIASSLERESLNELTKRSIAVEESERLYKTLFNTVSHEMRTPLSTILGAADGLLDDSTLITTDSRIGLSREIHAAALRLNRLVENLLDMTRLESGLIQPKLDWCDLYDLVRSTLRRLSQEIGDHPVELYIPPDTPLVRLDFGLMEQALTNLVYNAILYTESGTPIAIRVSVQQGECTILVTDSGPGLPAGEESKVFEKFYRLPGSRAGGTGLGLSIVKGFVEAHRGTVVARNEPSGGVTFEIRIPVPESPEHEA
jgi:two-component system, OmpR family, sensor histidine kinase KdpD